MNLKMEVTNFKMEVTKLPGISNNRGEYEMAIVIQKNDIHDTICDIFTEGLFLYMRGDRTTKILGVDEV
jgi:hypothetical protein